MLQASNPEDFEKMEKYGRAREILALLKYFPEISPVKNLTIVESVEDYEKNAEYLNKISWKRPDTPLGDATIIGSKQKGTADESPADVLKRAKSQNPNAVLTMYNTAHCANRLQADGGLSINIALGQQVFIDCVGKGFDGRETSYGFARHESYVFDWKDLPGLNLENIKDYRKYLVDDATYQQSVKERKVFLESVGYDHFMSKNS